MGETPNPTNSQHAATTAVMTALISHDSRMRSSNAGIKRNRRPQGVRAVRVDVWIDPETAARLHAARHASGQLSISLYMERLVASVEAQHGGLPLFHSEHASTQEVTTKAA